MSVAPGRDLMTLKQGERTVAARAEGSFVIVSVIDGRCQCSTTAVKK